MKNTQHSFVCFDLVMGIGTVRPSNMLKPEVDTEKKKTEMGNVEKECKVGAMNLPLPHSHLRTHSCVGLFSFLCACALKD